MTATVAPSPAASPAESPGRSALEQRARHEVRLFPTPWYWVGAAALLALYLVLPLVLSDLWANVLVLAGITAIGALGLNLLTGYAGQASLGTAAFIGIGAFTASYLGRATDVNHGLGQPFIVYLIVAILVGAAVGFVVGLPALRLRGSYLVIVTLGFLFVTTYVLTQWKKVSGGNLGSPMPINVAIGSINFASFDVFGLRSTPLGRNQGLFYLVWLFVALTALVVKNIVRSRPGRALQAVRDRDVAAEIVGVSLFRYKVGAFVVSSAIGAMAGVFYGLYIQYLTPNQQSIGLVLSIQFLAVIIVGGIGTVYGTIFGAVIIGGLPTLIDEFSNHIPYLTASTISAFQGIVFALLLVITLLLEPWGFAGAVRRLRTRKLRRAMVPKAADSSAPTTG
ncbi:MAG: livM [Actinomycetia bacterium]|nr:livM [Actinomycetes bacterium]